VICHERVRCGDQPRTDRQQLKGFLLRHDRRYGERPGAQHTNWLARQSFWSSLPHADGIASDGSSEAALACPALDHGVAVDLQTGV
jgi:hypothetical protein